VCNDQITKKHKPSSVSSSARRELESTMTDRRKQWSAGRVLLGGAGNIGSYLALELARRGIGFVRVIDRDVIEPKNNTNQAYNVTTDVGRPKAEVIAERMKAIAPTIVVEPIVADLEDVPVGLFADVGACLGALDSLRARQVLANERAWPLGLTVIDGAVGGWIGTVKWLVPSGACLECGWSEAHYRQLTREMPCDPGGSATGQPTNAPALVGATVATMMADELERLFLEPSPAESHEITFDLESSRHLESQLRQAPRCRFDHAVVRGSIEMQVPFVVATVGDCLAAVTEAWGTADDTQFEFRRRLFDVGLFGNSRWLTSSQLVPYATRRLTELNLTRFDQIRVKNRQLDAFLMMKSNGISG
jgi:sulfur carrier protein ThiS adenylyltransferase